MKATTNWQPLQNLLLIWQSATRCIDPQVVISDQSWPTPIFELSLHFGPNYTRQGHVQNISSGCSTIMLMRFCWLSRNKLRQITRNDLCGGPHYKTCLQNHSSVCWHTYRHTDALKTIRAFTISYSNNNWSPVCNLSKNLRKKTLCSIIQRLSKKSCQAISFF